MLPKAGDKVRVKTGTFAGRRGVVLRLEGKKLLVRVEESGTTVVVLPEEVTNFSLAARKAWLNMPDRDVGRKKGVKFCDRVSVTLRIDRDLWQHFQTQETTGRIVDRTKTINAWLREKLANLESGEREV